MTDTCPECGGERIGVEIRGVYDGALFWTCGEGHRAHRWPVGHQLHALAAPYVDRFAYERGDHA